MQQERDVLHGIVLPELKEFVKAYGKTIDLCDLRWGVNSSGLDEYVRKSSGRCKVLFLLQCY